MKFLRRKDIVFVSFLVFWGLSILAILIYFLVEGFDAKKFVEFLGIFINMIAFIFGAYFALLAVDAYAHTAAIRSAGEKVKEYERTVAELQAGLDESRQRSERLSDDLFRASDEAFVSLIQLVRSVGTDAMGRRIKTLSITLQCGRSRLWLARMNCGEEQYRTHVFHVREFRDRLSLPLLVGLGKREELSKEFRQFIQESVEYIQKSAADLNEHKPTKGQNRGEGKAAEI